MKEVACTRAYNGPCLSSLTDGMICRLLRACCRASFGHRRYALPFKKRERSLYREAVIYIIIIFVFFERKIASSSFHAFFFFSLIFAVMMRPSTITWSSPKSPSVILRGGASER